MFRIVYWSGPKIVTEYIVANTYDVEDGMLYMIDEAGDVQFVIRRTSLISIVRQAALVGGINGKNQATADIHKNVRIVE